MLVLCSCVIRFFWPCSRLLEFKPIDNLILSRDSVSFQSIWFDRLPPHTASVIFLGLNYCPFHHNSNKHCQRPISPPVWWTHFSLDALLTQPGTMAKPRWTSLFSSVLNSSRWVQGEAVSGACDHKDSSGAHPRLRGLGNVNDKLDIGKFTCLNHFKCKKGGNYEGFKKSFSF